MKHFYSLFFLLLLSCPLFSQSLATKEEEDGCLTLITNFIYDKTGLLSLGSNLNGVSLCYRVDINGGNETFALRFGIETISSEFSFDKNANLYLKTFSDKVVILQQLLSCEEVPKDNAQEYNHVYPMYTIAKDDLVSIMNEGIKKMLFMTTKGYYPCNYGKDIVGENIRKEYEFLLNIANKKINKESFDKDF